MGCNCKERKRPMELPPLPKTEVDEVTLYELNQLYLYFNAKYGNYEEMNPIFKKLFNEDININCGSCSYSRLQAHIKKLGIDIK